MSPLISVVMGVRNAAPDVERSVRSILEQSFGAFEFLVVDDGSTDATPEVLASLAREDRRMRIIRQENAGLTRALMRGCAEARGTYIARQDAGDASLPGRLGELAEVLEADAEVGFVCGSTELVGPGGEELSVSASARKAGKFGRLGRIALGGPGPSHHGATMFRRGAYEESGGYRACFAMAQDWDLWFRLIERSPFYAVDALHYRAEVNPSGISMGSVSVQRRLGQLAAEAHRLRMLGESDAVPCAEAAKIGRGGGGRKSNANGNHFIGAVLLARGNPACREYLLRAALERPLRVKTWALLAKSLLLPARAG